MSAGPMVSAGVLKTRGWTRPAGVERGKRVGPGVGHSAPSREDRLRPPERWHQTGEGTVNLAAQWPWALTGEWLQGRRAGGRQ